MATSREHIKVQETAISDSQRTTLVSKLQEIRGIKKSSVATLSTEQASLPMSAEVAEM